MTIAQLDYEPAKILMECETEPEQQYRVKAVAKERYTVDFIEGIPEGGVFYDVGANVGSYTLIAASRGLVTVAIEPGFNNFAALCRNALRNSLLADIIPLNVALAHTTGLVWFDYSDVRQGAASHVFGSAQPVFYSTHRQRVMTYRFDELVTTFGLPAPTHIKIDVDGNGEVEMAVLDGMKGTLASPELAGLILEIPLDSEERIAGYLAEHGWVMTRRFDERGGQKIAGICYGQFDRAPVPEPVEADASLVAA